METYVEKNRIKAGSRWNGVEEASFPVEVFEPISSYFKRKVYVPYNETAPSISNIASIIGIYSPNLLSINIENNEILGSYFLLTKGFNKSVEITNLGIILQIGTISSLDTTNNIITDSTKNYQFSRIVGKNYDPDTPPTADDVDLFIVYGHTEEWLDIVPIAEATGIQCTQIVNSAIELSELNGKVEIQWINDHMELHAKEMGPKLMNIGGNFADACGFNSSSYYQGSPDYSKTGYHIRFLTGQERGNSANIISISNTHIAINDIGNLAIGDMYSIMEESGGYIDFLACFV